MRGAGSWPAGPQVWEGVIELAQVGYQGDLPTAVGGWLERLLWEEGWTVLEGGCWVIRDWAEDWPWEVPGQ